MPDFGLMYLAVLTLLVQSLLLVAALAFGARGFLQVRATEGASGLRSSLAALDLCVTVLAWSALFFAPWRFFDARVFLWLPFVPLPVAATPAILLALGEKGHSGTARLMSFIAVTALAFSGGKGLQRWDFDRQNAYLAGLEDKMEARFLAAAVASEHCEACLRREGPCTLSKDSHRDSDGIRAGEFREYAKRASESAKFWRNRAYQ